MKTPFFSTMWQDCMYHFQFLVTSAEGFAAALPGSGLISRPSVRPMNPLAPRRRVRPPNARRYKYFHSFKSLIFICPHLKASLLLTSLSRASLAHVWHVDCKPQRSMNPRKEKIESKSSSLKPSSDVVTRIGGVFVMCCRLAGGSGASRRCLDMSAWREGLTRSCFRIISTVYSL